MAGARRLRSQKVPLEMTLASESAEKKKSIRPTPQKPERPRPVRKPGTQHDPIKAPPRKTRKRPRSQADLDEDREHGERDQAHTPTAVPLTTSPSQQPKHPNPDQNFNDPPNPTAVSEPSDTRDWVSSWLEAFTGAYEDMASERSVPPSLYSGEPPSKSDSPSASSRSTRSGQSATKQVDYQWKNLEPASIYIKDEDDADAVYPMHVAKLVMLIGEIRESSNLTKDSVRGDGALWRLMGTSKEEDVFGFFSRTVFPANRSVVLLRHDKQSMRPKYVPKDPTWPGPTRDFAVSTPVPDMLYGYSHEAAVSEEARKRLYRWDSGFANNNNLLFPFFIVEMKADEPMWAARNQCLGGASTCVRIMEQLNEKLQESGPGKAQQVDSTAFSVAINGLVAMLYVTWFDQGKRYLTRLVKGFFLHDFDQFHAFNDHVQNILEWGAGARLDAIRKALTPLSNVSATEAPEVQDEVASGRDQADEDDIVSPSPTPMAQPPAPAPVSSQAKLRAVAKSIPPGPRTRSAAEGKRARIA